MFFSVPDGGHLCSALTVYVQNVNEMGSLLPTKDTDKTSKVDLDDGETGQASVSSEDKALPPGKRIRVRLAICLLFVFLVLSGPGRQLIKTCCPLFPLITRSACLPVGTVQTPVQHRSALSLCLSVPFS